MKNVKELFYDWMGGNEVLFYGINGIRGKTYDEVMTAVSWLGKHEHFPYYLAGLLVWLVLSVLARLVMRKQGVGRYIGLWIGVFAVLLVGYATNGLAIKSAKDYFSYPRPYVALAKGAPVNQIEKPEKGKDDQSFPSGHVAFTLFMVISLWPVLTTAGAWFGVFMVMLMGWSRISLGVHFPADVMGAILITLPVMLLTQALVRTILLKLFRIKC